MSWLSTEFKTAQTYNSEHDYGISNNIKVDIKYKYNECDLCFYTIRLNGLYLGILPATCLINFTT